MSSEINVPEYIAPALYLDGFNCPHVNCRAYANQTWYRSAHYFRTDEYRGGPHSTLTFKYALCDRCGDISIWRYNEIIYPTLSMVPPPHNDMPSIIVDDYNEAREIFSGSPRASAALLRLATEKLTDFLIQNSSLKKGNDLNENISILVKDGMPPLIQKAMDSLRVIGNDAVHPGLIDFNDDKDIALRLFNLVNIIIDNRITQVAMIEELYTEKVPDTKKEAIEKRDSQESNE